MLLDGTPGCEHRGTILRLPWYAMCADCYAVWSEGPLPDLQANPETAGEAAASASERAAVDYSMDRDTFNRLILEPNCLAEGCNGHLAEEPATTGTMFTCTTCRRRFWYDER